MTVEEYKKNKINEMVEIIKCKMNNQGLNFTEKDEYLFKIGVEYGITLSNLILSNLPVIEDSKDE